MKPGTLFGPAIIYTLTNALTASIPFLLLPILTRVLTPDEYGVVTMFVVFVSIMGAFTGLNVHGAVSVRYFQIDKRDFSVYVSGCMFVLIGSTSITLLLIVPLLPLLERLTGVPQPWLLLAVLLSGLQFIVLTQLAIFQSSGRPWRFGALRIAQFLLDAAASLILVVALGLAWKGRIAGMALALFLIAIASLMMLRREGWIRFVFDGRQIRDALRFGVPLVPHTVGGILIAAVDRFLISNVVDVRSTGVYMVALQMGMILGLVTDSFNRAYAPWLFAKLTTEDEARDRRIVRMTYLYFVSVTVVAFLLGWLAPLFMRWFVGDQFQEAAPLVLYIAIGFAFGGMYLMVTNYVFFAGRTASLAWITLSLGVLNVLMSYVLLKRLGILGAAQAYMIVQALLFVSTWWLAQKCRPMPWLLQPRNADR